MFKDKQITAVLMDKVKKINDDTGGKLYSSNNERYVRNIKNISLMELGDPSNSDELDFIENTIINFIDIPNNKMGDLFKQYCDIDLNINILQDPDYYRIDIAPQAYKDQIISKYEKHLEWLRPLDQLNRATVGFESALQYLKTDNTHLLEKFWQKTNQLDGIRNENILDVIPELGALK